MLRHSLLPGLARALAFNLARGRLDLRLFEVASVHARGADGAPLERRAAAIGASGLGADSRWPSQARPYDLLDLKGAIEALFEALTGEPAGAAPGGTAARLVFTPG